MHLVQELNVCTVLNNEGCRLCRFCMNMIINVHTYSKANNMEI